MTQIRLIPADPSQKSLVANLIQLYLYDMTETMPFPIGVDGRFEYDFLDRFWRVPYLIYLGDDLIGFALVIDECPLTGRKPCWFMAEFFVLKAYRRQGAGQAALEAALSQHPGNWHIAVPQQNKPAQSFWAKALLERSPATENVTFGGDEWLLRQFVV